ncbi:hypothetical protein DFQ30_005316, partial [Apophysomyces sp. BC1015]
NREHFSGNNCPILSRCLCELSALLSPPPPPDEHLLDFVLNELPPTIRQFDDNDVNIWRHLLFVLREIDRCTSTTAFAPEPQPGTILVEI